MISAKPHPADMGFDFDVVIAETVEAFIRIACEQYGSCDIRPEHITHFLVEECLAMEPEVVGSIFGAILRDSVGTGLQPMRGAVEVLSEMSERAPVTIITARPEADPVHCWLEAIFPAPVRRRLRVVAMGDHDDKARHIRQAGLSTFIDDRAETCVQLSRAGLDAIVFSQPWNRDRHSLPTVHSWAEIRALCL
ncbi:MAG: hypothetical protein RBT36_03095 [Desulfobulbus sp.]|jgi:hypothetical protein|nr:hypothetical protein [Desulfobulbus sp.]